MSKSNVHSHKRAPSHPAHVVSFVSAHASDARNIAARSGIPPEVSDPEKFVQSVANQGYATDPLYAEKLKAIIRLHVSPLLGLLPVPGPMPAASSVEQAMP